MTIETEPKPDQADAALNGDGLTHRGFDDQWPIALCGYVSRYTSIEESRAPWGSCNCQECLRLSLAYLRNLYGA